MQSIDIKIELMNIELIRLNPKNPRKIEDKQFELLKKSIVDYPRMLYLRPIIVNADYIVAGGNMRLLALKALGYTEIPVIRDSAMTPEEQKQFIIKDNVSFGIWDYDILGSDYDIAELSNYGVDINKYPMGIPEPENLTAENTDKRPTVKIVFELTTDLEQAKPELEQIVMRYANATLSVSAGEI